MFRLEQLEDLDQPLLRQNLDEFPSTPRGYVFLVAWETSSDITWENKRHQTPERDAVIADL